MAGFSIIDFIVGPKSQRDSVPGVADRPYTTVMPVAASPTQDQLRSDAGNPPYRTADTLDDFGEETDTMRDAYLRFYRVEPTAKAAVRGKANAIKCLDVSVMPRDKNQPNDVRAAEFLDWAVKRTPHGWDGMIGNLLMGGFLQGWSPSEIVLDWVSPLDSRLYAGFAGLKYLKPKNTKHLRLQMDAYRNVLGVVNGVMGLVTYPRRKVCIFTHDGLFDDPTGSSDLRAAYRACQLIDEAIKLWYLAEKVFGGPVVVGKYSEKSRRQAMEKALDFFRAGGWISIPKEDEVAVVSMASDIGADGKSKLIDKMREEVFLAVRGAFSPFMPGGSGAERGNTQTNKSTTSDPDEEALAKAVGRVLTHDLAPALTTPNFPPGTGVPIIILGGVNWFETKTQLEVVDMMENKLRRPVDDAYIYNLTKMPPGQPKTVDPMTGQPAGGGAGPPGAPGAPGAAVDPSKPLGDLAAGDPNEAGPDASPNPVAGEPTTAEPGNQLKFSSAMAFGEFLDALIPA